MTPGQIDELIRHLESEWHNYGPFTNRDLSLMSDSGYELQHLHRDLHSRQDGRGKPHRDYHMNQNRS